MYNRNHFNMSVDDHGLIVCVMIVPAAGRNKIPFIVCAAVNASNMGTNQVSVRASKNTTSLTIGASMTSPFSEKSSFYSAVGEPILRSSINILHDEVCIHICCHFDRLKR